MSKNLPVFKKNVVLSYSQSLGNKFDLWLLVDHSDLDQEAYDLLQKDLRDVQTRSRTPIHVLMYDFNLETRMFPTAVPRLAKIGPRINYITHAISIVLWWRICGGYSELSVISVTNTNKVKDLQSAIPAPPVWIVEMDAGFSGEVRTFFEFYQNQTYDLIANDVWQADPSWLSFKRPEAADYAEIDDRYYHVKSDFVIRMSPRLLYHLDVFIRANVIAYGEAYESTLCKSILSDWCTIRSFKDDGFVGEVLAWDGRINHAQWRRYNMLSRHKNKWFHAVLSQKEYR